MAPRRGWGEFRSYVSVADRHATGRRAAERILARAGREAAPVQIAGRQMAKTFWGKAWGDNLERQSRYASRLERGRTYARNGSLLDVHIAAGRVEALVAGSDLYKVTIAIAPLPTDRWTKVVAACAGQIGSLVDLLRGQLSSGVMRVLTGEEHGMFPTPGEIEMDCSCPDWVDVCKHIAATLYGVGARLDQAPELYFTLRQVDQADLLAAAGVGAALAGAGRTGSGRRRVAPAAVAALFGIELADGDPEAIEPAPRVAGRRPSSGKAAATRPARAQPVKRAAGDPPAATERPATARKAGRRGHRARGPRRARPRRARRGRVTRAPRRVGERARRRRRTSPAGSSS